MTIWKEWRGALDAYAENLVRNYGLGLIVLNVGYMGIWIWGVPYSIYFTGVPSRFGEHPETRSPITCCCCEFSGNAQPWATNGFGVLGFRTGASQS